AELTDDRRLDLPSTVICTAFSSDEYKQAVKEGMPFLAGIADLRDVTWVDLPTSHWPMWSRPQELARIIGGVANDASSDGNVTQGHRTRAAPSSLARCSRTYPPSRATVTPFHTMSLSTMSLRLSL